MQQSVRRLAVSSSGDDPDHGRACVARAVANIAPDAELRAGHTSDRTDSQVSRAVFASNGSSARTQCLVPWCQDQLGEVPQPIAEWLELVRDELNVATKTLPQPPSDWARPAGVTCQCEHCSTLKTFLADGTIETDRLAAGESTRKHVLQQISRDQLDVETTLSKSSRPYALVMSKTQGSYERAVKQFEIDSQLLQQLPPKPKS